MHSELHIVYCGLPREAMQALGARSALLARALGRPQPCRPAIRYCKGTRRACTAPIAAAPTAASGSKAPAGAAAAQQRRSAASSSSADAGQPQLPRVILKGGKSKLFTGVRLAARGNARSRPAMSVL